VAAAATPRGFGNARIIWTTAIFILAVHVLAIAGVVHLALSFSWQTLLLAVVWYALCGLSITAGYHRLFAHRSFRASPLFRAAVLAFGAAAWQRSVLEWCGQHRVHHRHVDQDPDPYSVRHGFWWAHFGWVISDGNVEGVRAGGVRDLERDPLVRLQARYWGPLAVIFGAVIPTLLGALWGDALGAFLVVGCLRVAIVWQSTYCVNSVAHRFGRRPYARDLSARDNIWVALAAFGEGYHNFHHRFASDYRNGVRWFHYDPTKWLIWTLSRIGLASGLTRVPKTAIARARASVRNTRDE
jgi:stearoyl-CoA desaturase (delta-9 desaturase)